MFPFRESIIKDHPLCKHRYHVAFFCGKMEKKYCYTLVYTANTNTWLHFYLKWLRDNKHCSLKSLELRLYGMGSFFTVTISEGVPSLHSYSTMPANQSQRDRKSMCETKVWVTNVREMGPKLEEEAKETKKKKGKSYKQRKWSSHWHSVTAAARCVWVRKKIGATKPLINLWALNLSVPPSQWNPISLSQLTEGVGGRQRHVSLCISLPSGIHRPTSKVNFDFIFYAFFNLLLLLLFLKILL